MAQFKPLGGGGKSPISHQNIGRDSEVVKEIHEGDTRGWGVPPAYRDDASVDFKPSENGIVVLDSVSASRGQPNDFNDSGDARLKLGPVDVSDAEKLVIISGDAVEYLPDCYTDTGDDYETDYAVSSIEYEVGDELREWEGGDIPDVAETFDVSDENDVDISIRAIADDYSHSSTADPTEDANSRIAIDSIRVI